MANRLVEFLRRRKVEFFGFWNKNGFSEKQPKRTLKDAVTEIYGFSKYARTLKCPSCKQRRGFQISKYERGDDGWEFTMFCQKCRVSAVVNNTGFQFNQLAKGKK